MQPIPNEANPKRSLTFRAISPQVPQTVLAKRLSIPRSDLVGKPSPRCPSFLRSSLSPRAEPGPSGLILAPSLGDPEGDNLRSLNLQLLFKCWLYCRTGLLWIKYTWFTYTELQRCRTYGGKCPRNVAVTMILSWPNDALQCSGHIQDQPSCHLALLPSHAPCEPHFLQEHVALMLVNNPGEPKQTLKTSRESANTLQSYSSSLFHTKPIFKKRLYCSPPFSHRFLWSLPFHS